MKLKLILTVSLLAVCGMGRIGACGWCRDVWNYDCDLFRIMPYGAEHENTHPDRVMENCLLWQQQTSQTLPLNAIREAVYDYDLNQWRKVAALAGRDSLTGNPFVDYLVSSHDTLAIGLLCHSKEYEEVRCLQNDPWYYPLADDEEHRSIERILAWAESQPQGRYASRIAFLRIKALCALRRDEECVDYWEKTAVGLKGDCLYGWMEGYAAGAMLRTGDIDRACEVYVRLGDIESLVLVDSDVHAVFRVMLAHNPNAQEFPKMLQLLLNNSGSAMGLFNMMGSIILKPGDVDSMIEVCDEACANPKVANKTMWKYVKSALMMRQHDYVGALKAVERAEAGCRDRFLEESVRCLRMYARSRAEAYSESYEKELLADLRWLDARMRYHVAHPSASERKAREEYLEQSYYCGGVSYISDAIQYVILGYDGEGVAERLKRSGQAVKAIQLSNYADNRLLQIMMGSRFGSRYWIDDDRNWTPVWSYSQNLVYCNDHDYHVATRVFASDVPSAQIEDYLSVTARPRTAFDRFFADKGQHDADYWNDIVGTQKLLECDYKGAVAYLKRVSPSYYKRTNVWKYMSRDPFDYEASWSWRPNAKYGRTAFATRMADLEEGMAHGATADDRADSMLLYSIGMRNASNGNCWYLTDFEWHCGYSDPEERIEDWPEDYRSQMCAKAFRRQAELQQRALGMYADPERKAAAYGRLYMISKVMTEYGQTRQARYYAEHCDKWRDWMGTGRRKSGRPILGGGNTIWRESAL